MSTRSGPTTAHVDADDCPRDLEKKFDETLTKIRRDIVVRLPASRLRSSVMLTRVLGGAIPLPLGMAWTFAAVLLFAAWMIPGRYPRCVHVHIGFRAASALCVTSERSSGHARRASGFDPPRSSRVTGQAADGQTTCASLRKQRPCRFRLRRRAGAHRGSHLDCPGLETSRVVAAHLSSSQVDHDDPWPSRRAARGQLAYHRRADSVRVSGRHDGSRR